MKQCSKCKIIKEVKFFSKKSTSKDGYGTICKQCHNEYSKTVWYPKNREQHTKSIAKWRKKNKFQIKAKEYGVEVEVIEDLFQNSKGCGICGKEEKLNIDHCHKTGKVRGLLCYKCNLSIGLFYEDLSILKSAIKYLKANG